MSADGADSAGGADLQFDKVDLVGPGQAQRCRSCQRPIAGEYFEISRNVICGACAGALAGSKQGRGAWGRALLYGVGAALLGTIAWYAIVKITNHEFGLLAIGVGLLVGNAVKKGARGLGGWRYQALAVVLTYVSITASYVPLVLKGFVEAGAGKVGAMGPVLGLAFAAPFLGGTSNIMGILILGIGLYEAWKINRRVPLSGPFRFGPATNPLIAAAPASALPPTTAL